MLPCSPDGQISRAFTQCWRCLCQFLRYKAAGHGPQGTAMLMENPTNIDSAEAPSLAPNDRPIDLVHLARTTLGDRNLEREVLQLFDRQSTLLIARMRTAAPSGVATLAHTLKGSALGIGAWRVARAA